MLLTNQIQEQLKSLQLLIATIDESNYCYNSKYLMHATIGGHTRHIIELIQCTLHGYNKGFINYFKRERNLAIETNKQLAINYIDNLLATIYPTDKFLYIINEDGSHTKTGFYRELLYQLDHIIHHLALIRVSLIEQNIDPNNEHLGVAYSTINYKQSLKS
ncbi:MAG: hypothetical protein ACOVNR_10775 [Chitinophagaceae bacterium]